MNWITFCIILGVTFLVKARDEMDARIVAAYSTKTAYSITTSTTTVPLTCASAAMNAVCLKRRYRRYNVLQMFNEKAKQDMTQLEGSLKDDSKIVTGTEEEENQDVVNFEHEEREPRIAITVWTTRSSTYTVTSTSVNSSTTLSLSYYCTITGANLAPACG